MINDRVVNDFFKNLFLIFFICYIYIKIINYKEITKKKTILLCFFSLCIAIINNILVIRFNTYFINKILCFLLLSIVISWVIKNNIKKVIFPNFISTGMAYIGFIISGLATSILIKVFFNMIGSTNTIVAVIVFIFELILLSCFFKIKRFKNRI